MWLLPAGNGIFILAVQGKYLCVCVCGMWSVPHVCLGFISDHQS